MKARPGLTVTFDYHVTDDSGKTWHPERRIYTGIREPFASYKPGELITVSFLAEQCETITPE